MLNYTHTETHERSLTKKMCLWDFKWHHYAPIFSIGDDSLHVTTDPHTDLWQRTYYRFRNDNAPMFLVETDGRFFSFSVKTDFTQSGHRFDQCGIVMYLDAENWLKASVEYENEKFQHLGSVVTNHGYSDWATTEIDADVKTMWYRLSRREDDFLVECSPDEPFAGSPMRTIVNRPSRSDAADWGSK